MIRSARFRRFRIAAVTLACTLGGAGCIPPSWGANALLHPPRRQPPGAPSPAYQPVSFDVDSGVRLVGWLVRTTKPRRGLVVYLHGIGDNRGAGVGIAQHFTALGFDVLAYDGRAHGQSGGPACTYGYFEKRDLARVLDQLGGGTALVFGISLGAAVALQAAAQDARIALVVAVAPFSDLRTAARERAPFFASQRNIDEAIRIAETEASFRADDDSPVAAASSIRIPVILVHGAKDGETPPAHSERIDRALAGPHQLVLVPGAHHNEALTPGAWAAIDAWVATRWPK